AGPRPRHHRVAPPAPHEAIAPQPTRSPHRTGGGRAAFPTPPPRRRLPPRQQRVFRSELVRAAPCRDTVWPDHLVRRTAPHRASPTLTRRAARGTPGDVGGQLAVSFATSAA